nr:hypothetical protein [uncultured Trichococcus sp.]
MKNFPKLIAKVVLVFGLFAMFGCSKNESSNLASSEVIFCEDVDNDLNPINSATTFSAGQFYVKLQTPSAFDTREINVTIYSKNGSSESIIESSDQQVNQEWNQVAMPITLTDSGEYKVTFSRTSDSVIIGEGEVTIK